MEPHKPDSRWWLAAWLVALLLVILGAKLWIIQVYGSPLPYWDQWDEAKLVFKPWLEGHLTWGALFAAHNEHRIVFTRLLDLLELRLNGQWDPELQNGGQRAAARGVCLWTGILPVGIPGQKKGRPDLRFCSRLFLRCRSRRRTRFAGSSRRNIFFAFSRWLPSPVGDSERRGRPGGGWDWPQPFWLCSPWHPGCWRR